MTQISRSPALVALSLCYVGVDEYSFIYIVLYPYIICKENVEGNGTHIGAKPLRGGLPMQPSPRT